MKTREQDNEETQSYRSDSGTDHYDRTPGSRPRCAKPFAGTRLAVLMEGHPTTDAVLLGLRPEHVTLGDQGGQTLETSSQSVEATGPEDNAVLSAYGQRLFARFPEAAKEGDRVTVRLDLDKASLLDNSGQRLN